MSQFYLNGPSRGNAMSAEEFAAGACQSPAYGCCCCGGSNTTPVRPTPPVNNGASSDYCCCCCCDPSSPVRPAPPSNNGCDCCYSSCEPNTPVQPLPPANSGCDCCCPEPSAPVQPLPPVNGGGTAPDCPSDECCCCQQMICCCHPVTPTPRPPQVEEGCCCKQSFRAALNLLCDQQISSLLDFDAAAFITNTYTAGTTLTGCKPSAGKTAAQADGDTGDEAGTRGKPHPPTPPCSSGASDNLGSLSGSFRRFAPCSCDLLDIDAKLYTSGGKGCSFTATQVSLCELDAVVLQGAKACAEGEWTADEVTARNFRCLRARLAQRLNPCGDLCGQNWCSCACDSRDCCCAAGLLATLAQNNLSRRVSLAAGLLVLTGVTLLGTVGNVLVLANDADNRLYFVCVNSVQFIG